MERASRVRVVGSGLWWTEPLMMRLEPRPGKPKVELLERPAKFVLLLVLW